MAIETEMFRLLFLCHERGEFDGIIYERERTVDLWNKLYNNISDNQYMLMYWRTRAELSGIRYSGDAA